MTQHEEFIDLALGEAARGKGSVEPNPQVGAVLVKDGDVIATGYHARFGGPHAEIDAIRAAGAAAEKSTLYVTLEPCSHQGKTPPCTTAIIQAGITKVVAAMQDPNPLVSGKGLHTLHNAGISVINGVLEEKARRLNAPYIKLTTTGMPYITAKWAMTLDGKIATSTNQSQWISSEESRSLVHELRGRMDAVIVGIGTVLADDPLLTARGKGPRVPTRVILDSRARTPLDSKLLRTLSEGPVLVVTASDASGRALENLRRAGAEVISTASAERVDVEELLSALGLRQMTNVLLEGGKAVFGSFFDKKLVDAGKVFVSPKVFGGTDAPSPVGGQGIDLVTTAYVMQDAVFTEVAGDILIEGTFANLKAD
ncbi:bifunctional diaminohydroxyphosphoribosylaminopyrimidine deaminase/5-amino-6-(5-phosphoribosylamino)uracil reductase RibD [Planctomycetota bacterium]